MIIRGKEVILTKNQAVRWHRRMWNYIAKEIRDGVELSPLLLKRKFKQKHHIATLQNTCFCCEFAEKKRNKEAKSPYHARCFHCPVVWETTGCTSGEYDYFIRACMQGDREEAYRLARAIARLPKKEAER